MVYKYAVGDIIVVRDAGCAMENGTSSICGFQARIIELGSEFADSVFEEAARYTIQIIEPSYERSCADEHWWIDEAQVEPVQTPFEEVEASDISSLL